MRGNAFRIDAFVVRPEHPHAIWTLPPGDADFPTHWRLIKTRLVLSIPDGTALEDARRAWASAASRSAGSGSVSVRDEVEFRRYLENRAVNPVKHGRVGRPADRPYSSFHRDVRRGILSEDWDIDLPGEFSERDEPGPGGNRLRGQWSPERRGRVAHCTKRRNTLGCSKLLYLSG